MLFLKSTSVTKAPGIYEVDVAAKPPGKTYGVFLATDPDNQPTDVLAALAALGFTNTYSSGYTHKDRGMRSQPGRHQQPVRRHRRDDRAACDDAGRSLRLIACCRPGRV